MDGKTGPQGGIGRRSRRDSGRPLGVSAVAALTALGGIIGFAALPVAFGIGGGGTVGTIFGVSLLVVSAAQFVVAVGIFRLAGWGYLGAIAVHGLSGILGLLTASVGGAVLSAVVLVYLYARRPLFR